MGAAGTWRIIARAWLALLVCPPTWAHPAQETEPGPREDEWIIFTQEQQLAELVDACSGILGIAIEYDPEALKGGVTIRMVEPLSTDALWTLANRALYARGLTSIQAPGSRSLTIVPVGEAPTLARVEEAGLYDAAAEFEWARKLMPGHPDPRLNLAITLERSGREEEATAAYTAALEAYPDYLPAMQGLARQVVRDGGEADELGNWLHEIAMRSTNREWREWAKAVLER